MQAGLSVRLPTQIGPHTKSANPGYSCWLFILPPKVLIFAKAIFPSLGVGAGRGAHFLPTNTGLNAPCEFSNGVYSNFTLPVRTQVPTKSVLIFSRIPE